MTGRQYGALVCADPLLSQGHSAVFGQHRNSVTQSKAKGATALPSHQTLALLLRRGFRLL